MNTNVGSETLGASYGSVPELLAKLVDILDTPDGLEAFDDLISMAESVLEDDIHEDDELTEEEWAIRNAKSWEVLELLKELSDEFS